MNGLVDYGSSDDDDQIVDAVHHVSNGEVLDDTTPKNKALPEAQVVHASGTDEGPVLGPSRPDGAVRADPYEEDVNHDLPPMNERDLLRYLTRPSHPATSLPPEPTTSADPAVTAKVKKFLELKSRGIHFNEELASKNSFKNPGLFALLLERAQLPPEAQYASILPKHILDLESLPTWAYKEELLKSQQLINAELEMTRKAQSAAGKRSIEFTSAKHGETEGKDTEAGSRTKRKRH